MSVWTRIANVFRQERVNREIDEELKAHLAEAIDQGRDPEEARRALGSTLQLREASRDARLLVWLDSLRADVLVGWRQLRRNPIASSALICSLALGMGACVSAFRLIDALLLRPLPVANPERLFFITHPFTNVAGQTETGDTFDYPQFRFLRAAVKDEAELMAISRPHRHGLTFGSDDEVERFWRQSVSGWMFGVFGLRPALGRLLTAGDDAKSSENRVAVLSHDYWTRRFGRDPSIIGRRFGMDREAFHIVGVAERGFTGTEPGMVTDIFVPAMTNTQAIDNPRWGWVRIWAQVRPGFAPESVRQKLRAATSAWRQEQVKTWPKDTPPAQVEEYIKADIALEPASAGVSRMQRDYRRSLVTLGVLVGLVLLIACVNAANLMMARAAARAREMAMRVSIGAGRRRLIQLVLVESMLIASLASMLGAVFAWWSAPFVVSRINSAESPARLILPADWRVVAFASGLAAVVAALFGLLPALRASAVKPMSALRGGDDPHSRRRVMNALIAAQVAFCIAVLFVAGLFVATAERLTRQPLGFAAERLLAVETVTRNNVPRPYSYWDQVRRHLEGIQGVESVALSWWALMTGNSWSDGVWVNGQRPGNEDSYFLSVSPGWLQTMRIPLIAGRDLVASDSFPATAIVNEAFARRYFEGRNPLGLTFETGVSGKRVQTTIAGYAADARYLNMRESIRPTVYLPFSDPVKGMDWATFVVRTKPGAEVALAQVLRREVTRARPEYRVVTVRPQTELAEQHTVRERLLALLSIFFAAVALLLACVGLYGMLSFSVLQRRREIGIRIALGALGRNVARQLTAEIVLMLAAGTAIGLSAGIASQRFLESLLYDVKAGDWNLLALPVLTLLVAGACSALPPVMRAVRTDPATTLRAE